MTDALAKFFASLTFNQVVLLVVMVFVMVVVLIIVLARSFRIEKISAKGIEFDTDGNPAPKKRVIRRRHPVVKK